MRQTLSWPICVVLTASWWAVTGPSQLHSDDKIHQQYRKPEAYDEYAARQEQEHSVWSLPCVQGQIIYLVALKPDGFTVNYIYYTAKGQ